MRRLHRTFCPTNTRDSKDSYIKKLHSLAFYALVTPAITLSSAALLAEQSAGKNIDRDQQSTQRTQDAREPTPSVTQDGQSTNRGRDSDSRTAADRQNTSHQSRMQGRGYMKPGLANDMQASHLIGAKSKTTGGDDVGPVSDLIIDGNGQVVAIVVGVGGLLGMGQKNVTVGWNHVTKSGTSDEPELKIDVTREDLRSAPEFEKRD